MKKHIYLLAIVFAMSFVLIACSDDNNAANDESSNDENSNESNELEENLQENNTESQNQDEPQTVDKGASHGEWGEDELGLGVGDTATLSTNFAITEITLDSVEQVEDEDAFFGQYTVLHMTVNNIGDEPAEFEDIFEAAELSDDVVDDGVEGGSMWEDVTLEESPGEVGVGEEVSGALFYDVEDDVDKYELFINAGFSSTSNKVSFKFDNDEIE